jgi:RNA polymerase sigma factor (sigma-70 family)
MPDRISPLLRLARPTRSDRDLLRAYLAGRDPAAFEELVRRHAGLARRAAAEVCPAAADDAAQAALALLARKASAVAARESAAGWVFETARRLALKARTAAARRATREAQASPPPPPADPLDALTLREVRAAVAEELARLPDALRLPLVLCYWDGADRPAAAARLGCSVSTLKRRLDVGRDRLAARLARRGFAGPAVLSALTAVQAGADAAPLAARAGRPGLARWKVLAALAVAAGAAAVGIGVGGSGPIAADPPAKSAPPAVVAGTGPAVDRYGDPLPDGAVARLGTVRFRHGGQLHTVAYSPDGKVIASGGFGRIMLWEADTGKPIAPLVRTVEGPPAPGKLLPAPQVEQGHTFGLAFTTDGKSLISAGSPSVTHDRGHVVFWDVEARKWRKTTEHLEATGTQWMRAVVVSPDGKAVAAGSDSGKVYLMDTKTQATRWQARTDGVGGLSFAPDGAALAVATYQRVVVLDATTGRETHRLEPGRARQVAFAPDGKSVWVGCDGGDGFARGKGPGKLVRWDLGTGTAVQTFETVPDLFLSLAVTPDGKTLASGGVSAGPFLWDAATGKATDLGAGGPRLRPWVHGLAFAPDGKTLADADTSGRVRVWDVAGKKELHRHDEHAGSVLKVALSPDGQQAATAGGDGTVRVWDLATGRALRSWTADDTRSVFTVAYTPDGRHLLTAGWDGSVRLWEAATAKEVRRFRDDKGMARAALSPDGTLVATSGKEGPSIVLSETATSRPVRTLTGHVSDLMWVLFTPDGRRLVSAADMHSDGRQSFDDRSIRVWDVATGRQVHKFDTGRPHGGSAVSPDGRVLAAAVSGAGEASGALRFWDLATGKELEDRRIAGIGAVAFSPDGRYLAAADRDIRLIEAATGRVVQTFESGAGSANGLTFTLDGRRLLSAHDDGTVLVWDLTPRPVTADRAKFWDELASDDPAAARRAAAMLAADPAAAVALLGEKLRPVPKPAGWRPTAALIADLDAATFAVREAASKELVRRSGSEFADLSAALEKSSSEEVRRRLGEVLRSAPSPWPKLDADDLRRVRVVGVLEAIGTPEARRLLRALADGDPYALVTREARGALGR